MKSTHQDFPYPGHMSLTVRNSVGAIKVETDPDAVGARVYLDGEVLDGVTITPNGERLEVDLGSPRGSMYGAASAGTGGREIRNDLSGSTRGTVMQIGWADSIDAPEGATVIPNGGGGATIFYEDQDPEVLGSFLGMDKGSRTATATNPDVTIVLPPHSNVTLRDVSQGATLSGEFGTLGTFDTIKGPITTEGTFREVSFATEGDITVRGVAADSTFDLRAEGNGKIVMDRVYGHGNAKTVNGDITVTVANPDGMVDLSSAHGDIAATATTPRGRGRTRST